MTILKCALYVAFFAAVGAGLGTRSARAQCDAAYNNLGVVDGNPECWPQPSCGQPSDQCEMDQCLCAGGGQGFILFCVGQNFCGRYPGCFFQTC